MTAPMTLEETTDERYARYAAERVEAKRRKEVREADYAKEKTAAKSEIRMAGCCGNCQNRYCWQEPEGWSRHMISCSLHKIADDIPEYPGGSSPYYPVDPANVCDRHIRDA